MIKKVPVALVSGLLIFGVPAWAADEHHPADDAGAPSGMMTGPGSQTPQGGMMGGAGQRGMMSGNAMMGNGAMPMMSMMTDHVEGRLAFLKTEIKITEAQMPKWDAFTEAVRASLKEMTGMRRNMMQAGQGALPARIERNEKALSSRLEALRKIKAAVEPLYASFSDEQKRIADQLMVSPMGMIGMM